MTLEDNDFSLEVEYDGDRVECNYVKIYDDMTIGLDGCKVDGEEVDYSYGEIYTKVEYIESTGTQWIDTGLNVFNKTTEIKFEVSDTTANVLIGSSANIDGMYNVVVHKEKYYWGINGSEPSAGTVSPNEIYTVKYNDKEGALIVNNTVLSSTDFTPNKEEIIYIGHKIYQQEHSRAKFYSIKIYDKETQILVRDFIPVLDKEGTPCLYDKVEKKFYYNQGTGEFEYK